ncbi:MAG: phosphatase PAP2 family protein [Flavitalea sp.]
MSFLESIISFDKELFRIINVQGAFEPFDGFMKFMRHQYTWVPLYAFILWYVFKYAKSYLVPFIAMSLVCFAITDFTSASIIKPLVGRLRPCHDPELANNIRILIGCGGPYSFPSSHASNHFGLATFWFFAVASMTGKKWYWLWLWAGLICYAQIYVGKHFPLDIAGGFVLGLIAGIICSTFFNRWIQRFPASTGSPS